MSRDQYSKGCHLCIFGISLTGYESHIRKDIGWFGASRVIWASSPLHYGQLRFLIEVLIYSSDILVDEGRGSPRGQSELLLSIFTLAVFLPPHS